MFGPKLHYTLKRYAQNISKKKFSIGQSKKKGLVVVFLQHIWFYLNIYIYISLHDGQ